jgi:hypothetical protein
VPQPCGEDNLVEITLNPGGRTAALCLMTVYMIKNTYEVGFGGSRHSTCRPPPAMAPTWMCCCAAAIISRTVRAATRRCEAAWAAAELASPPPSEARPGSAPSDTSSNRLQGVEVGGGGQVQQAAARQGTGHAWDGEDMKSR